ncbi:MAG: ABC transporter substrate-binding protein [Elusimicrobia bacterium]|nr:ABC transporter substrate-binding protein [Elusimicrobiota bacterium]
MIRLMLCASLSLAGLPCAALAAGPVKNPDTYTYVTISDADSMDPAWAYDSASDLIILNVYDTLWTFDKGSTEKLIPLLATKIPSKENGLISPDGKTYTIPLRKGVKFHDGTLMTPEDVRYSILRFMLLDRAAGPSSLLLEPLLGEPTTRDEADKILPHVWEDAQRAVTVRGDDLVLRLKRPYAPILSILATWAPVLSKNWAIAHKDWDGTEATWTAFNNSAKEQSPFFEREDGTGPFKLDRWDRRTQEFLLERWDGYWRAPAKIKYVVVKGVNEFGTRKLMLMAGDADAIYADRPLWSQLQGLPGVKIIDDLPTMENDPVVFFTYKVNTVGNSYTGSGKLDGDGIPPDFFADKDVRKGFAYAFDYKDFIGDVLHGKGTQATGSIPASMPGHNPHQRTYHMDMAKAAAHFKKAFGGQVWEKGFHFTIAYNSGNMPRETVCQIIKRNVESLNPKFKIDVRSVEWPTFLDAQKDSKLPIFVLGWNADYPDPHNFAFPLLHSKGDYPPYQHFKDPEMDRIIEQANVETNPAKRKQLYYKLQALEYEEVPHLNLVDEVRYRTQRDWVKGWVNNPVFPDAPYGSYFYTLYKQ